MIKGKTKKTGKTGNTDRMLTSDYEIAALQTRVAALHTRTSCRAAARGASQHRGREHAAADGLACQADGHLVLPGARAQRIVAGVGAVAIIEHVALEVLACGPGHLDLESVAADGGRVALAVLGCDV